MPPTSTELSRSSFPQISTQGIVAIAVCTSLAIASAIILLLCVLRRRRKQQEAHSDGNSGETLKSRVSRVANDLTLPPADSYQPLISPSHSVKGDHQAPLTPPLRLRDRKLLPSLLRPLSRSDSMLFGPSLADHQRQGHNMSSSSSMYSTNVPGGTPRAPSLSGPFPSNSVCSPSTSKLEPRQEKMQVASTSYSSRLRSPPPVSFTSHSHTTTGLSPPELKNSGTRQPFNGSYSPLPHEMSGSEQTAISTNPLAPTPPSSPIRPRRPHDEPLEIPDLVSPMRAPITPPPTRALPPRPLHSTSSIGVARTTSVAVGASISLQSLSAGHCHDDSGHRYSWGSWGEEEDEDEEGSDGRRMTAVSSGRMFGVSFPPGAAMSGRSALPL